MLGKPRQLYAVAFPLSTGRILHGVVSTDGFWEVGRTGQGVVNDDDIIHSVSILYKDNLEYHNGLHRAIFQNNDVIFIISFGNEDDYISICINFKHHLRRPVAFDLERYVYTSIAHVLKDEGIKHAKWLCYGFPFDLSDLWDLLIYCPYEEISLGRNSLAAHIDKETIYKVFNNRITSNSIEVELVEQE